MYIEREAANGCVRVREREREGGKARRSILLIPTTTEREPERFKLLAPVSLSAPAQCAAVFPIPVYDGAIGRPRSRAYMFITCISAILECRRKNERVFVGSVFFVSGREGMNGKLFIGELKSMPPSYEFRSPGNLFVWALCTLCTWPFQSNHQEFQVFKLGFLSWLMKKLSEVSL